jgi:opacity protein-like surface antigen
VGKKTFLKRKLFKKDIAKMLKKISYTCLSVVCFSVIEATAEKSDACHMSSFNGFYAGLMFGESISKNSYEARNQTNVLNAQTAVLEDLDAGFFAGWGKELATSQVYLGLEAAYLLIGGKSKVPDLSGNETTEIKRKDSFELSCRLGFVLNKTLPYIKIGYASTKFQVDTLVPSAANVIDKPANISDRLNGFVTGVGMDHKLSQKLMIGLGYTYVAYSKQSKQFSVDGGTTPISPNNYLGIQNKPNTHNVMLRLGYTF